MELTWTSRYPSPADIRREVDAMVEVFVEVLRRHVPTDEIAGIYLKGSARKVWDSPIDYVPELSDVDVHILFHDEADIGRRLGSLEDALTMRAEIEEAYHLRIPQPIHFPEPQFIVLNRLLQSPEYCPSPRGGVQALYGEELVEDIPDADTIRELDRSRLLALAPRVEALPLRVIDKPSAHLFAVLRDLNWQVSPTGPRVLTLLGVAPDAAWTVNRTRIVALLDELGEHTLAEDYAGFYLAGWDYFLSGYAHMGAAEAAIRAFAGVMQRSIAIAARTS